jgi:hypothetical protein
MNNAKHIHALLLTIAEMVNDADMATLLEVAKLIEENPADNDWAEHLAIDLLHMEGAARERDSDEPNKGALLAAVANIYR